jgi:hypothetical protein
MRGPFDAGWRLMDSVAAASAQLPSGRKGPALTSGTDYSILT